MKKHNMNLEIGTRIYYGGDMANQNGFGAIANRESKGFTTSDGTYHDFGAELTIEMDDGREINVTEAAFSPVYKGHGGTRFVTEAAYYHWRHCHIRNMQEELKQKELA